MDYIEGKTDRWANGKRKQVWGAICFKKSFFLYFIDENLKRLQYLEILEDCIESRFFYQN